MKHLLAILGSPHAHGSTSAMLDCAVSTAKKPAGKPASSPCTKKISPPAPGCRACMAAGACIRQDDVQEIARLLKTCDGVILAAPTYWANVPGPVKNLFDRLLGTAMEDTPRFPKPRLSPNQRYLLLTACNTPYPFSWICGQSRGALRAMERVFKTSGMKCNGEDYLFRCKRKRQASRIRHPQDPALLALIGYCWC